ncbi:hypothetical protein, partial [Streptomyces sp. NRRL WC-3618]|uniref:hypothetical protein n=1 Tax=Streptomyces sp. NRRL WC-3618 TaxID=1519490 RepID=UPI001F48D444
GNLESTEEIGSRSGLIESETQDSKTRARQKKSKTEGKLPGGKPESLSGEYKGSVRSLRTQQRAKNQRQIC